MTTARAKSLLKYTVALALLYVILRHAETDKIAGYLAHLSVLSVITALMLVTCAQIASAFRMRYFFTASHFSISKRYGVILFYVGAFYNFLLPGGIGGDAYKVILARRRMNMPAAQGIRIMLADRASGLCVIMFMMIAALMRDDFSSVVPHAKALLALAAVVTLLCYLAISQRFLKQKPAVMITSLLYSCVVQGLWLAFLVLIWNALGTGLHLNEYIALYGASGIAGMLPVSVGGLGIKEMAYFYGAHLFDKYAHIPVDPELGVALSLCVFTFSFVCSLPGLWWLNKAGHAEIA